MQLDPKPSSATFDLERRDPATLASCAMVMVAPNVVLSMRLGGGQASPGAERVAHDLLIELVRSLARAAARADCGINQRAADGEAVAEP